MTIIGAGPAGLSLAQALLRQGVQARIVDPRPDAPFSARYGLWQDEARALGIESCVAAAWSQTEVRVGGQTHRLHRGYSILSSERLRQSLGRGIEVERGSRDEVLAALRPGELIVDCAGADPSDAAQTAYGVVLSSAPAEVVSSDAMLLMDFHGEEEEGSSFLYGYRRPDGTTFVEETSLAAAPPLSLEKLRRRLLRRLARAGLTDVQERDVERCVIPLRRSAPRVFELPRFGASAGLVHPCTGYSLASTLRHADRAAAVVANHRRQDRERKTLAHSLFQALWPKDRLETHALFRLGLDLLLRLDAKETAAFFDAVVRSGHFFSFMDPLVDPQRLAVAMADVFARLDPAIRRKLLPLVALRHPSRIVALAKALSAPRKVVTSREIPSFH